MWSNREKSNIANAIAKQINKTDKQTDKQKSFRIFRTPIILSLTVQYIHQADTMFIGFIYR